MPTPTPNPSPTGTVPVEPASWYCVNSSPVPFITGLNPQYYIPDTNCAVTAWRIEPTPESDTIVAEVDRLTQFTVGAGSVLALLVAVLVALSIASRR